MENTIQQKNKDLVLEAFDTLFNKRDYARAETFWNAEAYPARRAHRARGQRLAGSPRRQPEPLINLRNSVLAITFERAAPPDPCRTSLTSRTNAR